MDQTPTSTGRAGGGAVSSDLMVKAAWLYYVEGLTQEQIAERFAVNRMKVARMLAACTEQGVIVTTITGMTAEQAELERALEQKWGLSAAMVVPSPTAADHLERSIGHGVAKYLTEQMQDGMTLAIGGGATLNASLGFLIRRSLKSASVISLVGSLPHSQWINPSSVAGKTAELLGVHSYQLTAPVVVNDSRLRDLLWQQEELQDVRRRAAGADIALLTVGDMSPGSTIFRHSIVPPDLRKTLIGAGAVANILCYFVNAQGQLIDHDINTRVMAIDLETLRKVPNVVLAAGGAAKLEAIRAALKAVGVTILITDADTARRLISGPA